MRGEGDRLKMKQGIWERILNEEERRLLEAIKTLHTTWETETERRDSKHDGNKRK